MKTHVFKKIKQNLLYQESKQQALLYFEASPLNIIHTIIAIGLTIWSAIFLVNFPIQQSLLAVLGLAYLVGLIFLPWLWLLVLPLITVAFDLTSFSGRAIFNELDMFFLLTFASGFFCRRYSWPLTNQKLGVWLIIMYVAYVFIACEFWKIFPISYSPLYSNPYYLPEYGIKTAKGAIWALFLLPLWADLQSKNQRSAEKHLIVSAITASLVFFVLILWERGTLGGLLSGNLYQTIIGSFLNFSDSYRTTGIFSDMHTGGEVVDGILLLLLPIVIYGSWSSNTQRLKAMSIIALGCLGYIMLVGFTRATYVSFFLTLIFSATYLFFYTKRGKLSGSKLLVFGMSSLLAIGYHHINGGRGLLIFSCLILGCYSYVLLLTKFKIWPQKLTQIMLPVGFALVFCFSVYTHYSGNWFTPSATSLLLMAMIFITSVPICIRAAEMISVAPISKVLTFSAGFLTLVFLVTQATSGYKINERMGAVQADLQTRFEHWNRVLSSDDTNLNTVLFGSGAGTFPLNYLLKYPETVSEIGSFSILNSQTPNNPFLQLGGGHDLSFSQRIPISPDSDYKITLSTRSESSVRLGMSFCERNLLFANNFMANCSAKAISIPPSQDFISQTVLVNSNKVGKNAIYARWPTTFAIKNVSKGTTLDINSIEVYDGNNELLQNGDFEQGLDHWFFFNDFSHLPWHVKNTLLNLYYDWGITGLLLLALIFITTVTNIKKAEDKKPFSSLIVIGLIGFFSFGMFGSPLDSPRVDWLMHFLLFIAYLNSTTTKKHNLNSA